MRLWGDLVTDLSDLADFLPDRPRPREQPGPAPKLHGLTACPACLAFDLAFLFAPESFRIRRTVELLRHSHQKTLSKT